MQRWRNYRNRIAVVGAVLLSAGSPVLAAHIPDGPLGETASGRALLVAGCVATALATAFALRRMDFSRMPQVALLSSAFFVLSLFSLRLPPASVHPMLLGLIGLLLGWAAFPALLVALLLQAVFFQHGGITTLGLNTFNMAFPAVLAGAVFLPRVRAARTRRRVWALGFAAGAMPLFLAGWLVAVEMMYAGNGVIAGGNPFACAAAVAVTGHALLALIEGAVCASTVVFLCQVRPEMLGAPVLAPERMCV